MKLQPTPTALSLARALVLAAVLASGLALLLPLAACSQYGGHAPGDEAGDTPGTNAGGSRAPFFRSTATPIPLEELLAGAPADETLYFSGIMQCHHEDPTHYATTLAERRQLSQTYQCRGWSAVGVATTDRAIFEERRAEFENMDASVFR